MLDKLPYSVIFAALLIQAARIAGIIPAQTYKKVLMNSYIIDYAGKDTEPYMLSTLDKLDWEKIVVADTKKPFRVLFLGVGTGHGIQYIKDKLPVESEIIGVDISRKFLDTAEQQYPNDRFICMDASQLKLSNLGNEPVDMVVFMHPVLGNNNLISNFLEGRQALTAFSIMFNNLPTILRSSGSVLVVNAALKEQLNCLLLVKSLFNPNSLPSTNRLEIIENRQLDTAYAQAFLLSNVALITPPHPIIIEPTTKAKIVHMSLYGILVAYGILLAAIAIIIVAINPFINMASISRTGITPPPGFPPQPGTIPFAFPRL